MVLLWCFTDRRGAGSTGVVCRGVGSAGVTFGARFGHDGGSVKLDFSTGSCVPVSSALLPSLIPSIGSFFNGCIGPFPRFCYTRVFTPGDILGKYFFNEIFLAKVQLILLKILTWESLYMEDTLGLIVGQKNRVFKL